MKKNESDEVSYNFPTIERRSYPAGTIILVISPNFQTPNSNSYKKFRQSLLLEEVAHFLHSANINFL